MDRFVKVTDETSNANVFDGILLGDSEPDEGDRCKVFVLFDGSNNGFGDTVPAVKTLKKLPNGKYGA